MINPHEHLVPALVGYIIDRRPVDWPAIMQVRNELETAERQLPVLVVTVQSNEQPHPKLARVVVGFDFVLKATETREHALLLVRGLHQIMPDIRAFLQQLNDPLQNPLACRVGYRRWWWQGTETEIDEDRGNWTHRVLAQCYVQER